MSEGAFRPVLGAGESAMKRAARSVRSSSITATSKKNHHHRKARVLAAAALSAAAVTTISRSAMAQNLYWDRNGTAAGTTAASTGSWDLASLNWSTDSLGAIATSAWASGNTA